LIINITERVGYVHVERVGETPHTAYENAFDPEKLTPARSNLGSSPSLPAPSGAGAAASDGFGRDGMSKRLRVLVIARA